jgi:cellulose synthase/poly-beta-1,6-N-acetylglucosamine synthase-like glycosyltransferase
VTLLFIAWLLTDGIATYGVWHFWRSFVPLEPARDSPAVAVLVAIKGTSADTAPFLESLCRQTYPHYRIIFALESAADPAWVRVTASRDALAGRIAIDLVNAGTAAGRTQKVHNLREALHALRDTDRIVVFADADTRLPDTWLTDLVRPIARGEVEASTGYRWPLPQNTALATRIGAAADLSMTTSARSRLWNVCWGGSCAVERRALDAIALPDVWEHAASDDVTLTRALRRRGFTINSPLRSLVPSPVSHTWPGLFAFARRQHLMLRTYAPRHWLAGGWILCVPALGAAVALADTLAGNRAATLCLLLSAALLQVRCRLRRRIAGAILPAVDRATARATLRFAAVAWPLVHAVHCAAFLSSCLGQRFTWAGIRYRISARGTHFLGPT